MTTREISYRDAIREALVEEMRRDPDVFLIGEDIAKFGGSMKVTEGLLEVFGDRRVIDTPIAEAGFVGIGVGAALTGLRPVVEVMFNDFILLAMLVALVMMLTYVLLKPELFVLHILPPSVLLNTPICVPA